MGFKKVFIDVGASDGSFSKHILQNTDNSIVYAFEPNLEQYKESLIKLELEYPNQFKILNYALSDKDGVAKFYGAKIFKGLVGSLNEFNQEKVWDESLIENFVSSDITDYQFVNVMSVSKFLRDKQISTIEFLKIDAQGSDVKILELFLKIAEVKCAVVEVNSSAISSENAYVTENSFEKLMKVCELYSMKVIKIVPAGPDLTEYNIIIGSDPIHSLELIEGLKLAETIVLGRFWKVLGLGIAQKANTNSTSLFLKKFVRGLRHPISSAQSVAFKLTR